MLGGQKLSTFGGLFNVDGTLTISGDARRRPVASLNLNSSNTWAGQQSFNVQSLFYGYGFFYNTAYFYGYAQFYAASFFYTNAYYYGAAIFFSTINVPTWVTGAIPFVDQSANLYYDADDYYRDNISHRYGFGIGQGDTMLAKIHSVGTQACYGSPPACSSYGDSASCYGNYPCYWTAYESCGSYMDETSCNNQQGCAWNSGTNCNVYNSDQMGCQGQSGCSWNGTGQDCGNYTTTGYESCVGQMGCSWNNNSCGAYSNAIDCNAATPCSWAYQNCSDFDNNQSSCLMNMCMWSGNSQPCTNFNSNQSACENTGGCSWNYNSCYSFSNSTDCNNNNPCFWEYNDCSVFNGDQTSCQSNVGCSWQPSVDCTTFTILGQAACEGNSGCAWNGTDCYGLCTGGYGGSCLGDNTNCSGFYYDGTGSCTGQYGGSCTGDNAYCSGTYYTYSCDGIFGQGCQPSYYCTGTPTPCSYYSDESGCEAISGCSWEKELAGYYDGGGMWGAYPADKNGWWGATPVEQSTGWTITPGYSPIKAFNPESTSLTEVARVLGTLIDQFKTYGQLG